MRYRLKDKAYAVIMDKPEDEGADSYCVARFGRLFKKQIEPGDIVSFGVTGSDMDQTVTAHLMSNVDCQMFPRETHLYFYLSFQEYLKLAFGRAPNMTGIH